MPPMALMNEALRRGELEVDGVLELQGARRTFAKQGLQDFVRQQGI